MRILTTVLESAKLLYVARWLGVQNYDCVSWVAETTALVIFMLVAAAVWNVMFLYVSVLADEDCDGRD